MKLLLASLLFVQYSTLIVASEQDISRNASSPTEEGRDLRRSSNPKLAEVLRTRSASNSPRAESRSPIKRLNLPTISPRERMPASSERAERYGGSAGSSPKDASPKDESPPLATMLNRDLRNEMYKQYEPGSIDFVRRTQIISIASMISDLEAQKAQLTSVLCTLSRQMCQYQDNLCQLENEIRRALTTYSRMRDNKPVRGPSPRTPRNPDDDQNEHIF